MKKLEGNVVAKGIKVGEIQRVHRIEAHKRS